MATHLSLQSIKQITLVGFMSNLCLGLIKLGVGYVANSQGLFADGIHTLSDLLTDSFVFVAAHFGGRRADQDHPYGHARIETVANVFIAGILFIASLSIIYGAWQHLHVSSVMIPHRYAIWVALGSMIINEWLFHATYRVALDTQSELLKANAWHHRSDAASSGIVLFGIFATSYGFVTLDAVAAVIVGLIIAKMAITLTYDSLRELIDTAVDDEILHQIRTTISSVSGVKEIHQLRTRMMAGRILVDAHVLVDGQLTVSEGHHISQRVHLALKNTLPKISDVTIHIDPEDDETTQPSLHLPSRQKLIPILQQAWQNLPGSHEIRNIGLHYLDGCVHVDVYLSAKTLNEMKDIEKLRKRYQEVVCAHTFPLIIQLYFSEDRRTEVRPALTNP